MASFDYKRIEKYYFPILEVKVSKNNVSAFVDGLLDSGALVSLFTKNLADALNIKIEEGRKEFLGSIGKPITIFIHDLEFEVLGKKFTCPVAFSKEFEADFNIIGRLGFFEHFIITFDDKNNKLKIE